MNPNRKLEIGILLDGGIINDARIIRVIKNLMNNHSITLHYCNPTNDDNKLFNDNVQLKPYQQKDTWINRNILFHNKFKPIVKDLNYYDVFVIVDYPILGLAPSIIKKFPNSKIIYDSHEIWIETINQFFPRRSWKQIYGRPLIKLNKFIHYRREKKLVEHVDQIITVCDSLKAYFEKRWKLNNEIIVVKNCPDNSTSPPIKGKLFHDFFNLSSDAKIVLYQGQMNPGRGVPELINAANFFPSNLHLVLLGDGPSLNSFKKLGEGKSNVHFHPKVPANKLLEYTASSDIGASLIQPINKSKELSLPNKLFEYMFVGVPFISNALPEPKLIVEKFNVGKLIESFDPENIAHAIKATLSDERFLNQVKIETQNAVANEYNWDNQFNKYKEYIISLEKEKLKLPALTIGMPVYNDLPFIEKSLNSIIHQTFEDFQLIILDDCSTDGSSEICKAYAKKDARITYYRNENNIGISRNMKKLLDLASTKYFMWAGDDDILEPDFTYKLMRLLSQSPFSIAAFCNYKWIDINDEIIKVESNHDYSGDSCNAQLKKVIQAPHDAFGYGMFYTYKIKSVDFPVWKWPNKKTAYNNIYPSLLYYLASGKYIHTDELLWKRRNKSGKFVHHKTTGSNWSGIFEILAFILRKINLVIYSEKVLWRINPLKAMLFSPYLLYYWIVKPSIELIYSSTKNKFTLWFSSK